MYILTVFTCILYSQSKILHCQCNVIYFRSKFKCSFWPMCAGSYDKLLQNVHFCTAMSGRLHIHKRILQSRCWASKQQMTKLLWFHSAEWVWAHWHPKQHWLVLAKCFFHIFKITKSQKYYPIEEIFELLHFMQFSPSIEMKFLLLLSFSFHLTEWLASALDQKHLLQVALEWSEIELPLLVFWFRKCVFQFLKNCSCNWSKLLAPTFNCWKVDAKCHTFLTQRQKFTLNAKCVKRTRTEHYMVRRHGLQTCNQARVGLTSAVSFGGPHNRWTVLEFIGSRRTIIRLGIFN